MNEFDFDFSANNEETKIEASLPLGKYICMIDEVGANENGTLIFKLSVIEDERGEIKYQGRKLTDYKSFSPNARKYSLEAIKKMSQSVYGQQVGNKMAFKNLDDYKISFIGKNVKISVKHEEYNGDMQAKVSSYISRNADDPFVLANLVSRGTETHQENHGIKGTSTVSEEDVPF